MTLNINWHPENESQQAQSMAKWLSYCLKMHDSGKEDEIPRNPFYRSSRGPITEDYINRMIAAIDDEFSKEVTKNPDYHWKNSGSTIPPEFYRLGPRAKRALVEGLDRLMGHERFS